MSELSIKLEGFPEKVQRIADALENTFPGMFEWVLSPDAKCDVTIQIEGFEVPAWAGHNHRSSGGAA